MTPPLDPMRARVSPARTGTAGRPTNGSPYVSARCFSRFDRTILPAAVAALLLGLTSPAQSEEDNTTSNRTGPISASARLDFTINVDKMIYLRIDGVDVNPNSATESGLGPAAGGEVSELVFNPVPSIPSLGTTPVGGNSNGVDWNTAQPRLVNTPEQRLFVEVRSNAGPVGLQAQVITPLTHTNGLSTIPFSKIRISETNRALKAPTVPDSGIGPSETVDTGGNGTDAAPGLLTHRFGQWGFYYLPGATSAANPFPTAGVYRGELAFIATAL